MESEGAPGDGDPFIPRAPVAKTPIQAKDWVAAGSKAVVESASRNTTKSPWRGGYGGEGRQRGDLWGCFSRQAVVCHGLLLPSDPGIPRWPPIPVLTRADPAWLPSSDEIRLPGDTQVKAKRPSGP